MRPGGLCGRAARRALLAVWLLGGLAAAAASASYPFTLQAEAVADGHRLVARNPGPAPVSLRVDLAEVSGLRADRGFPLELVVPPATPALTVARLRPLLAGQGYRFRTRYDWLPGDFTAQMAADALYRLPFADGLSFRIGQAPGGPLTTHARPGAENAVDIPMPEGTPVVAARAGTVIVVEESHQGGGQTPEMLDQANEVRVLHADGTLASYAHLAWHSAAVVVGQRVAAGERLGLSGSTGYSSGPHLHFAVLAVRRGDKGFSAVALPFRFFVGNPPEAFAPRPNLLLRADYGRPGSPPETLPARRPAAAPGQLPVDAPLPTWFVVLEGLLGGLGVLLVGVSLLGLWRLRRGA